MNIASSLPLLLIFLLSDVALHSATTIMIDYKHCGAYFVFPVKEAALIREQCLFQLRVKH